MKYNYISFVRGDSYKISRYFTDKDGNVLEFDSDTDQINFTVRESVNSGDVLIEKDLSDMTKSSDNKYTISISPEDTEELNFGTYGYDIEVRIGEDFVKTVEGGEFIIKAYDYSRPAGEPN